MSNFNYLFHAFIFGFLSLIPTVSFASATPEEIVYWYEREGFSGQILVKKEGRILLDRQIGKASWEQSISFAPVTPFYIGSVTKQITAAAILKLQEQGVLNVNDRLDKFFPAVKFSEKISLLQLLSHTSGLKNYTDLPEVQRLMTSGNAITTDEILALVDKHPLDFEPGTKWSYCNTGYILLGLIVEQVSGKSINTFWQENFFQPLSMGNAAYTPDVRPVNEPSGHSWDRDYRAVPQSNGHMSWAHAAGGVYATVYDMMKWSEGLHQGTVLAPESYTAMTTPILEDYGLGLIVQDFDGKKMIGHGGGMPGFTCQILALPDDDLHVIVLTNLSGANGMAGSASVDFLKVFSGREVQLPAPIVEQPLSADDMNLFVGDFVIESIELAVKVRVDSGNIYLAPAEQDEARMLFVGDDTFFLKIQNIRIKFSRDETGKVAGFVLTQNGRDFVAVLKR